jgi:hypothetical protein
MRGSAAALSGSFVHRRSPIPLKEIRLRQIPQCRWRRGELQPSISEMVKLLDLERRLQTFETLEQLNELTLRGDPLPTGD